MNFFFSVVPNYEKEYEDQIRFKQINKTFALVAKRDKSYLITHLILAYRFKQIKHNNGTSLDPYLKLVNATRTTPSTIYVHMARYLE